MADSFGAFERVIQQLIFPGRGDAGEAWCPPETARTIAAILAGRGPRMNGLVRQAVRLKRLVARADGVRGERFLYVGLRRLTAGAFAGLIGAARDRGALAGVVNVQDQGVVFLEAAMGSGTKTFDLGFRQMAAAAALLDILANALGYRAVEAFFEPITGQVCKQEAEQVAKAITSALHEWLEDKLESEHFARQERAMAQFLKARGEVNADAVGNEAILDIWRWMTGEAGLHPDSAPTVDGFRGYRAAARRMLVYRAALEDRALELKLEGARRFGEFERPEAVNDVETDALPGLSESALSPLAVLLSPPADAVKWFRNKDDAAFVGDLVPAEQHGLDDDTADADESDALFIHREPDPRLFRTFLRYATFGRVQASLSQAARTGRPAAQDDHRRLYGQLAERTTAIQAALEEVELATAHVLLELGRPEGLLIAKSFDPTAMQEIVNGPVGARLAGRLARGDAVAIAELARAVMASGGAFGKAAKTAYGRVARAGFRQRDRDDSAITEALAAGVESLGQLRRLLGKVQTWLAHSNTEAMNAADYAIFDARFRALFETPGHRALPSM
ncbi:MAG: hypothetical protein MUE84_07325 [Hyphomonas sp.]|nr:hypothetical protein [Hyphomonas sp.]